MSIVKLGQTATELKNAINNKFSDIDNEKASKIEVNQLATGKVDKTQIKDSLTDNNSVTIPSTKAVNLGLNSINNKIGNKNGIASLDDTGKVPSSQLPSYVDDIVEGYYNEFYDGFFRSGRTEDADNIIKGETSKIYVCLITNKTYRYSGDIYVEISASLALGETSSTAYSGLKGKENKEEISRLSEFVTDLSNSTLHKAIIRANLLSGIGYVVEFGFRSVYSIMIFNSNREQVFCKINMSEENPIITSDITLQNVYILGIGML